MKFRRKVNPIRAPSIYRASSIRIGSSMLAAMAYWFMIGILFYNDIVLAAFVSLVGVRYGGRVQKAYEQRLKKKVSLEFEQLLYGVTAALQAGKSVENCFRLAGEDIRNMFSGHHSILLSELERLNRKVEQGVALEKAIDDFQKRLDIPHVSSWAEIFRACNRTGGDLIAVMRHTSRTIAEKMNLDQELSSLIAGKRFEARALSVVPYGIIALFYYGSADYMEPLYSGAGRLVMTGALLAIVCANLLAEKIMQLE